MYPIIKLTLIFVFTVLTSFQTEKENYTCTVTIQSPSVKTGMLWIAFYKDAKDFKDMNKACYAKKVAVQSFQKKEVVFENIAKGSYAIAIFLDENADGKLNFNLLGIPKELFGFSNNVYPKFRSPTFKECLFTVHTHHKQTIQLQSFL